MRQQWRPAKVALVTVEGSLTYAQLDERVTRAAGWLTQRGLKAGDILALQLPKRLAFLELHLAAMALGIVTLPLNPTYTSTEVAFYLADSGARLLVHAPHNAPAAVQGTDFTPADDDFAGQLAESKLSPLPAHWPSATPAVILYTSGTTGRPKGAVLSHENLRATVEALHEAWRWSDEDVLIHALPLFHVHGLFVAQHAALRAGATTHWLDRFDAAAALDQLVSARGTVFMGVPTFYNRILALPASSSWDLTHVRLFTSGSAPLPAQDHERFEARFGHRILERYGMTEVGIVLSNPYEGERRPGSVGGPVPGAQVRIYNTADSRLCQADEVGEVQIKGPSVFAGYLGLPEQTAEALVDGWMRSGDLGAMDADGYIRIVGRSKDMVLTGGLNVYPSEVEAVLRQHPAVSEAAVVGAPDPDLGERVVATVVLADDNAVTPGALLEWCRQSLAPYKCPKAVEAVDELPRNAMGKVQKAALRTRWSSLRISRATEADLDLIVRWNLMMASETEDLGLDAQALKLGVMAVLNDQTGAWYLLARVGGQVVGQCMITVEWSDWRNRPIWWFQSVYVPPQWRRRGVFTGLFKQVESEARAKGAGGLRLYVERTNHRAARTYAALGMDDQHYTLFETLFDE